MTCVNRRLELAAEAVSSISYLSVQSRLQFLNVKAFSSVSQGRCVAGHQHKGLSPEPRPASHGLLSLWLGWRLPVLGLRRYRRATVQGNKNLCAKESSSSKVKPNRALFL